VRAARCNAGQGCEALVVVARSLCRGPPDGCYQLEAPLIFIHREAPTNRISEKRREGETRQTHLKLRHIIIDEVRQMGESVVGEDERLDLGQVGLSFVSRGKTGKSSRGQVLMSKVQFRVC